MLPKNVIYSVCETERHNNGNDKMPLKENAPKKKKNKNYKEGVDKTTSGGKKIMRTTSGAIKDSLEIPLGLVKDVVDTTLGTTGAVFKAQPKELIENVSVGSKQTVANTVRNTTRLADNVAKNSSDVFSHNADLVVADQIRKQIKLIDALAFARWGVPTNSYVTQNDGLKFKVNCGKKDAYIIITLNSEDTYDVQYGQITKNYDWKILDEKKGIYVSQLVYTIDKITTS